MLRQDAPADRIVEVVVHVGCNVRDARNLTLQSHGGQLGVLRHDLALAFGVLEDAVAHLDAQIQAYPVVLQHLHHAHGLAAVMKAARDQPGQGALARVAKRRVPQVVTHGNGLGQRLVEAQGTRDGARDLRDLQGVGQAGAVVIARGREKHLRLAGQATERFRVQDAIAIMLENRSGGVGRFLPIAAAGKAALLREGRQHLVLIAFQLFADCHGSRPTTIRGTVGQLRGSCGCFAGVSMQFRQGKLPVSRPQGVGIPTANSCTPRGKYLAAVSLRSYLAT